MNKTDKYSDLFKTGKILFFCKTDDEKSSLREIIINEYGTKDFEEAKCSDGWVVHANHMKDRHDIVDFKELFNVKPNQVNHPKHYNQGNIEVIDVIYDWKLNFSLGSAVKYIARADHKENPIQDLEKAVEYIEFEIANRKGISIDELRKEMNNE